MSQPTTDLKKHLPHAPVDHVLQPLRHFLHIQSASGILLVLCTAAALVLANSPWGDAFHHFWHDTMIGVRIGSWSLEKPLEIWINDALMTLFFFVVGLEIKRELVAGELAGVRKAALPFMAALGGILVPAAIYFALERGQPGEPGWGIPMATDIAFVVGILALFGKRVPLGLKIFLLSLAIVDDIGAILVIALFYSTDINLVALALGGCGFVVTILLRIIGVRSVAVYVLVGVFIWFAFFYSGIHPTISGVLLGLITPTSAWIGRTRLAGLLHEANQYLHEGETRPELAEPLAFAAREAMSPLARLEMGLHPWVAFVIMPVFALANAGVVVRMDLATHEVARAVALGLVVGKPIGIFLFSWLAVKLGMAQLPTGVNWRTLLGAGCLGGIGFTMSLFIGNLALQDELLNAGKIGTLLGSLVSALLGCVMLHFCLRTNKSQG